MTNPLADVQSRNTTETVLLADLLDQIAALILEYVELAHRELSMLLAVWIANTYTYECFDYSGYLHIQSETPQCGKTTLLKTIRYCSKGKPPILAAPTAAVVIRSKHAVLLIDEAERLRDHDKENFGTLLTALNAGVEKEGQVDRLRKLKDGSYEPESFAVYRPKALAGIEDIADTLESRSFHIRMKRAEKRPKRLRGRIFEQAAQPIRQQLEQWAQWNEEVLREAYDKLLENQDGIALLGGYDDRFQDLAEPLVLLASVADEERPDGLPILPRLMAGLEAAYGRRTSTIEGRFKTFLALARKRLVNAPSMFVSSVDLVSSCKEYPALADISSPAALAAFLKPFDLEPHSTGAVRGYTLTRVWLDKWSVRYERNGIKGTDTSDGSMGGINRKS
jgi:hypothetical protein